MGKVFEGDTGVKITLSTEENITGATSRLIKYIKPDLTTGQFTAIEEGAPATGDISYTTTSADDLDVTGRWTAWAKVTHSDGTVSTGEAEGFTIYPEVTAIVAPTPSDNPKQ